MKAKRIIAFILTFLFIMNCTPVTFAEDAEPILDHYGSKVAVVEDDEIGEYLTEDKRGVTVTLSLPSAEYKHKYDVMFVMDKSTSAKAVDDTFIKTISETLTSMTTLDADVYVGIVKFKGLAYDAFEGVDAANGTGLIKFDGTDKPNWDEITAALKSEPSGNGTNIQAGIEKANKILAADTSTPDSNKFIILLTDGKTYIWNEDGVATSYYAQWYKHYAVADVGKKNEIAINQTYNYDIADYTVGDSDKLVINQPKLPSNKDEWNASLLQKLLDFFEDFYEKADNDSEITGTSDYDTYCEYAYNGKKVITGTYSAIAADLITNEDELFKNYPGYKDYHKFEPHDTSITILEANPYNLIDNGDGTYTFDTTSPNENFYQYHATNLDKATYRAAKEWEKANKNYTTAVIYQGCSDFGYSSGWSSASGLGLTVGFDCWLEKYSDFAAPVGDSDGIKDLFTGIKEGVAQYLIGSGVVTDKIPEEFKLDPTTLKMTKDGKTLTDLGSDYAIDWNEEEGTITWTINVPVENAHPITLSYDLEFIDPDDEAEEGVKYFTNVPVDGKFGAVLEYETTPDDMQQTAKGTFKFPLPSVEYKKFGVSYEYTGTIPDGAPELPVGGRFGRGFAVTVAPAPEMDYYTFSGWDTDNFIMPAKGVVIKGSWEPIFYDITVNYVDADGNTLADSVTTDPIQAGTAYDVSELDQIAIDGYKWVSTSLDTKGDKLEKALVIDVVYAKLGESAVTVNYVDEAGNKIAESVVTTVQEGENYDVTALDQAAIAGYTYKETSGELTGTIGTEDITIDVIYTKNRPHKPSKDPDEPTVPEVPEVPAEPEVPEEPVVTEPVVPEEPAIIEEPEVPLAEPEEPLDIFEEEVPLADVPTTGDTTRIWLASFIFSALALGVLNLLGRREEEDTL